MISKTLLVILQIGLRIYHTVQMGLQIDDLNSRSYWPVNFEFLSGERSNLFQEQPIIAPVLLNLERV